MARVERHTAALDHASRRQGITMLEVTGVRPLADCNPFSNRYRQDPLKKGDPAMKVATNLFYLATLGVWCVIAIIVVMFG
jgi:hypothetical protein